MIRVAGVSKRFGTTRAVDDVSFDAPDSGVTYLLGPNGAGKTTVMRMIAGLTRPTAGAITINGSSLRAHPTAIREIGFSLSAFARNPKHTAAQHLRWQARLGGVSAARVPIVLEQVGLETVASRPAGGFSFGMLQRLGIASALLGDPKLIVLDEPANGLDVEGILWLRQLFLDLAAAGKCLLVASHNLPEVEITGTRVVVMGKGKVLSDTSKDELVALGSGPRPLEAAYLDITRGAVEYVGSNA